MKQTIVGVVAGPIRSISARLFANVAVGVIRSV